MKIINYLVIYWWWKENFDLATTRCRYNSLPTGLPLYVIPISPEGLSNFPINFMISIFTSGYLAERLKSSFRKFYGQYGDLIQQYEVSLSRKLNDILILDQQWLPNQSDFPPISWPWYGAWPSPIMNGFQGAFATGVACQQGTLTHPDTWFRPPLWDLLVLQLLRPDSSNLPCLYSTFHLEYPLVLSRFCLLTG